MKCRIHYAKIPARIFHLFVVSLLLIVCESSGQSATPLSPFAGSWTFTFEGGLSGSGTMEVSAEGKISVHVSIGWYERFFSNPIMLNVSDNGALRGDIYLWRFAVGRVEGSFSPSGNVFGRVSTPLFNVGSVSGNFSENSGAGSYRSVAGNGTWSARKN